MWQCRHSTSFSRTKNPRIPASTVANSPWRLPALPIAWGRISEYSSEQSPYGEAHQRGDQLAGAESANSAAIAMLITPPATVAAEIHAIVGML